MSVTIPFRLQRSRRKGARLTSPDGRKVVCCTRPGEWGNLFVVGGHFQIGDPSQTRGAGWVYLRAYKPDPKLHTIKNVVESIEFYRRYAHAWKQKEIRDELSDVHLACWCGLCDAHKSGKPLNVKCADCKPCHVDVIGEILYGAA